MDIPVKCSDETHNPFIQGSEGSDTFTIDKGCHGYPILNTDMAGADTFYLSLDVDPYNKTPHNFREGGGTPTIENFSIKDDRIILPPEVALHEIVLGNTIINEINNSISTEIMVDPHGARAVLFSLGSPFSYAWLEGKTLVSGAVELNASGAPMGHPSAISAYNNSISRPEGYRAFLGEVRKKLESRGKEVLYEVDDIGQIEVVDSSSISDLMKRIFNSEGFSLYEYAFGELKSDSDPAESSINAEIGRLYTAAFGRKPDEAGLQFWVNVVNDPLVNYKDVSQDFLDSPEFSAIASPGSSSDVFASALYQNVLGRDPDPSGLGYWTSQLDTGAQDRADVLMGFANSPENIALYETLV